jgi:aspartate/methionine/tyrosine aminotransferase
MISTRLKNAEISLIRKLINKAPENAINLGLGEIQFSTPKFLLEYAKEVLNDGRIHYTPNAGLPELCETIAGYYNISFADNICITVGAEEAIFATLFSYLDPGDEVLIANPSYLAYKTIIEIIGGVPVYFDLDPKKDFKLDKNSFLASISNSTKMVILNNPSNPLGINFSADEIEFIIEICIQKNIIIVVDEVYRELFLQEKPDSLFERKGNIIVISGLSKSHCMTGWRIGWAISNKQELIQPIITVHQYICTCAPFLSQKVAVKALSVEGLKANKVIRKRLRSNREFILKKIKSFSQDIYILPNTSSPYLFVNLQLNDLLFAERLCASGVIVVPGCAFGNKGKGWLRINYGIEIKSLEQGIDLFLRTLLK